MYWEFHHPNWLIFFRGVETTNQLFFCQMFNMFVAFPFGVLVKIRKARSILWRRYHVNGSFGEAGSSKQLPTTDPKSSNVQCPMSRRHGLMAVADFLTSYLPENDQLHLSRRFVEVGMCPWDSMFLLGELMMFRVLTHPFMESSWSVPNWGSHVFQVLLNYSAWAFNGVRASIRKSMQLMVLGDFPILFG